MVQPSPQGRSGDRKGFNAATHGLRGVASLMVFLAHMVSGLGEHVYPTRTAYVEGILPYWNVGTFGVDLFFVISGFVILPSAMAYTWREFAMRRFVRLYPLFAAMTLLFLVLDLLTELHPEVETPLAVFAALTFLDIFTPTQQLTPNAWSLTFEVWFYVFTAAGVYVGLRHTSRLGIAAVAIGALAFLAHYPIAFYFIAGIAVRLAYDRYERVRSGRHRSAELGMMALCLFLASRGHYNYDWTDFRSPVPALLILSTAVYFCLAVSKHSITTRLVSHPVIMYFGTVSYSLYLVHPYIYFGMRVLLQRVGFFTPDIATSLTLFVIMTTGVAVAVTQVVHIVLERWPYEWVYGERVFGVPAKLRGLRRRPRAVA